MLGGCRQSRPRGHGREEKCPSFIRWGGRSALVNAFVTRAGASTGAALLAWALCVIGAQAQDHALPSDLAFNHTLPSDLSFNHTLPSDLSFNHTLPSDLTFNHTLPSDIPFNHTLPSDHTITLPDHTLPPALSIPHVEGHALPPNLLPPLYCDQVVQLFNLTSHEHPEGGLPTLDHLHSAFPNIQLDALSHFHDVLHLHHLEHPDIPLNIGAPACTIIVSLLRRGLLRKCWVQSLGDSRVSQGGAASRRGLS